MKRFAFIVGVLSIFFFPHSSIYALQSASYVIEDDSFDYGGKETVTSLSGGSIHGSGSQVAGGTDSTSVYEVESGYFYYDDQGPVFAPIGSTDPDFLYWVQNITGSSATYNIHVIDDLLPSRAVQNPYAMRSGLNVGARGNVRIYYKASPGINPGTGDRSGTWGYSLSNGTWVELGDGYVGWKPVDYVENSYVNCIAHDPDSCVTESDGTMDGISWQGPSGAEVIRVTLDYQNHTIGGVGSALTSVSGNSVVVYKAVDMAGNITYSGSISSSPWLKTLGGSIHSNKNAVIFSNSPEDNVAYIISASGGIYNFSSSRGWEIDLYPGPQYVDTLTWTDLPYDRLIAGSTEIIASNLDAYESAYFADSGVYYRNGNLTVSSGAGFQGVENRAASTIIVDGDLYITENVILNNGGYVAFLVRGSIYISRTVSQIAGTYVADFDTLSMATSGLIETGDDSLNPTQLVVYGQLIARTGFQFNRIFIGNAGVDEPSELIVFDPQVLINTPPGLRDLPGLGSWEEIRPN